MLTRRKKEEIMDLERILSETQKHYPHADLSIIQRAFEFASVAHAGQVRLSGGPYLQHPLHVAYILAQFGLDPEAVAAGLLHDTCEDTPHVIKDVEAKFGPEIAGLVDGVTKLSRFSGRGTEEQQAENVRKMFLAMAEDVRVVIIKLADRLHNMRTLYALPPEKQERISRQTREIYAPLANRLGMWQMKWELEDLAFKYLEPEHYKELASLISSRRQIRERYVAEAIEVLRAELDKAGIKADLYGRPKHIYSIYKKMERKQAAYEQIYDVMALRVIVNEVQDCYGVLGIVHSLWHPIPGQFDDYIAIPKANKYQSLHTAVMGPEGKPLEVQIRTYEMHQVAEFGVAAHWYYKEGGRKDQDYALKLAWARQLLDWQREMVTATEFVESLKLDIFQDQVFVFTPKGEIKDLPAGSTPVDFAYRIHTDVGHRCIGAKVNGRLVPLDHKLDNGDIVEILTTKAPHGPSRDWLNLVKTAHAREKIRQWLKRAQWEENVSIGRDLLDRELKRLAHQSLGNINLEKVAEVAKELHFSSLDDLFAAVGYGSVSPQQVVVKLGIKDDRAVVIPEVAPPVVVPVGRGVRVKGVGDLLINIAKCCSPVPGDEIIGFITRGKGVTVHRKDCPNMLAAEVEKERLVEVEWDVAGVRTYPVAIKIEAWDRDGLLHDVSAVVAEQRVNILAANVRVNPDKTATITATLEIRGVNQLSQIMAKIEGVKDVYSVVRDLGPSQGRGRGEGPTEPPMAAKSAS